MAILHDEESQKNGSIWLFMNFNGYKASADLVSSISQMEMAIPNRIMGGHFCYSDPALKRCIVGRQVFANEHHRYRLREHFGSREEIDFELQTFGIPVHDCPVIKDGSCTTDAQRE